MKKYAILFGVLTLLVCSLIIFGVMSIGVRNEEVRLRNQFTAQSQNMRVVFDNTFKIIQQQAGVASEYKNSFSEIYPALMEGRYGNARGGALMSLIQESNPQFSTRLFEKLSDSIEIQRNIFTREQQKAIDIKREHDNLRTMFPSSLFVGGRPELKLQLVTSTKTEKSFESGKDDNIELFGKK